MRDDNSFLLRMRGYEPAFPSEPQITGYDFQREHKWAALHVEDLAKLMRYVHQNPHVAKQTGARARDFVVKHFSRPAVADIVLNQLRRIQQHLSNRTLEQQLPIVEAER